MYQNRNLLEAKVGTRDWAVAINKIILAFGRMGKTLELWARKGLECSEHSLTAHSNRSPVSSVLRVCGM